MPRGYPGITEKTPQTEDVSRRETQSEKKRSRRDNLPPGPGPGRPKGVPNKLTTDLKQALHEAAALAGGPGGLVAYLLRQAQQGNPSPFMTLLGKTIPAEIAAKVEADTSMTITVVDETRE